jgi:hypothetical protein
LFTVPPSGVAHLIYVDVRDFGYPSTATAVDLLVGCTSKGDGAYAAAYDGTVESQRNIAVYPTAPLRQGWMFGRGRVELTGSRFLMRVRPVGHPMEVTVTLKGYHMLD